MKKRYNPYDIANVFPKKKNSFRGSKHVKSSYAEAYIRSMKKRVAPPRMTGVGIKPKKGFV